MKLPPAATDTIPKITALTEERELEGREGVVLREPDAPLSFDPGASPVAIEGWVGGPIPARRIPEKQPTEMELLEPKLLHSSDGQYARGLEEMLAYFPGGDLSLEPKVSDLDLRWYILNEVAICLTGLNRGEEAIRFHQKNIEAGLSADPPELTGPRSGFTNLAEIYLHLGDYEQMLATATKAFELSLATKDASWQPRPPR